MTLGPALAGRIAIVTGASSGIGRDTSVALARAGGASFTITTTEHSAELALLG